MTIIQPLTGAGLGTVVLRPLPDVQPFSIQSGYSFEGILSDMRTWLRDVLVPYLNDHSAVQEIETTVNEALQHALDQIATADVPVSDALFAAVLPVDTSAVRLYLDSHYRLGVMVQPGTDTAVDYAPAIQAALDTGLDVYVVGPASSTKTVVRLGSTLMMTKESQSLTTRSAILSPAFSGDGIQLRNSLQQVHAEFGGSLQPSGPSYTDAAAIRVGPDNIQPMQCSVAESVIRSMKGSGVVWDGGSKLDFTNVFIADVSEHGINGTATYASDNNHGFFQNTHVIRAAKVGYWFQYGPTYTDPWNDGFLSGSHAFDNAKCFDCGTNFVFETQSCVGSVFSEIGHTPDQFTEKSHANDITVIQTNVAFETWVDNGVGNRLTGYSQNNSMETRNAIVRNLTVANLLQFPGQVKTNGARTGVYTVPNGTAQLAAGASTAFTLLAGSWAATLAAMVTAFGSSAGLISTATFVDASGALKLKVTNDSGSSIDISGYSFRWFGFIIPA